MTENTSAGSRCIDTKEDAVELLRELHPRGSVDISRAKNLATPWGVAEKVQEWTEKPALDNPSAMPVTLLLRYIVGHGTDERPMSCDEYFFGNSAQAIGGHGKCERGEYKGNLSIIERDAGMDMTHGLKSDAQNGTEPCTECGRTCIYAVEGQDALECSNCGTKRSR